MNLERLVQIAGAAQLALVLGSVCIPRILDWKSGLADLRPILRQLFWTYAGYILAVNVWFGGTSLFFARELVNSSALATSFTTFVALYWGVRLGIQFFHYDRSAVAGRPILRAAEAALVICFTFLFVVYGAASIINAWGG